MSLPELGEPHLQNLQTCIEHILIVLSPASAPCILPLACLQLLTHYILSWRYVPAICLCFEGQVPALNTSSK